MKSTAIYFALILVQCISIIEGDVDYIPISRDEFRAVKNSLDFTGKVVLVSGSSSGIGAATVKLFSYLGARVVVTGRNGTRINEIVEACRELSPDKHTPLGLQLDLTIPGNIGILVNETIKAYKKIDVLVNVAGIGNFATITAPNFNDVYSSVQLINENAPVELTRLCVPYILNTNGTIAFIASILARNPVLSTGAYSMGKNAIVAFANTLTHDLGPNVRVNVISPGIVDGTRIFRLLVPSPRQALIKNSIASSAQQRPGAPLDIAKAIVFLSSPLAGFVDGQELHLDAGAYIPLL